jgi:hypothetical protein
MFLRGKQRRAARNSHRPGGNALERGGDALVKLKNMISRREVSHRCPRQLGWPDHNLFSTRACVGGMRLPHWRCPYTHTLHPLHFSHQLDGYFSAWEDFCRQNLMS